MTWLDGPGDARRRQEEAARDESLRGQARQAYRRGDRLFQAQLEVGRLTGEASFFGASANELASGGGPDLLGQVEEEGWHLEHVSTVFVETGATSSNRFPLTGQGTVTQGVVLGLYVFRRVERG